MVSSEEIGEKDPLPIGGSEVEALNLDQVETRKKEAPVAAEGSPGKYKIAYEAAQHALVQQDGTLGNLRNRAAGLITIAALIGSFSSFFGLGTKDRPLPLWFAVIIILFIGLILLCVSYVMWPKDDWYFGPNPGGILERKDYDYNILWASALGMVEDMRVNGEVIKKRARVYSVGVVLLGLEAAFVVAGSLAIK